MTSPNFVKRSSGEGNREWVMGGNFSRGRARTFWGGDNLAHGLTQMHMDF